MIHRALSAPLLLSLLVACSTSSEPGPNLADGTPTEDETSVEASGTLVHTERLGKTLKVEFWQTETGAASVVTGSIDEDQDLSNLVNAALDRKSVAEAFLALPGKGEGAEVPVALRELDLALQKRKAAEPEPTAEEHARIDAARELAESTPRSLSPEATLDYQPVRPETPGTLRPLGPPAGWNWNSDYQWFRDTFCVGSQDCRTGHTWIYGGGKSNLTYHRMYGLNNSFDGTADFGSRWARWQNGAWVWRSDYRTNLPARNYVGITRYDGVGPFLRDGWISGYSVTNTAALSPTFTSTALGTDPRVSFSQNWTPLQLKGYAYNLYGMSYFNRCANNVATSFANLPGSPTGKIWYSSAGGQKLPPFNDTLHTFGAWSNHIQGVARLPGVGDNRWLVVSRAHDLNRAGLFLVHLGDLGGTDGTALGSATNTPSSVRASKYYYRIPDVKHPGGLQAVGKFVAVGVEAPNAPSFVEFFDFSTPGSTTASVQRFYLRGDQAENPPPGRVIGGVGITRLADARYLLAVLGQDNSNDVWFYVSDTTSITATTRWIYLDHFKPVAPAAQNVALITECGTGDIYLLATDNSTFEPPIAATDAHRPYNHAYLSRLGLSGFDVTVESVNARYFNSGSGDYCTFRAAVSPYVDPTGKLMLHCHTHHANTNAFGDPDSKLKAAEFAP
jgi:hypothetical protein